MNSGQQMQVRPEPTYVSITLGRLGVPVCTQITVDCGISHFTASHKERCHLVDEQKHFDDKWNQFDDRPRLFSTSNSSWWVGDERNVSLTRWFKIYCCMRVVP